MSATSTCLGYPRMGNARELKRALESFWAGKTSADELNKTGALLRQRNWLAMKAAGIDQLPSNDFSLYDHMLDMAVCVGAIPNRFRSVANPLARYFAMARGLQDEKTGLDLVALEMTKWFDTNYHYIVPEIEIGQKFELDPSKILAEIDEARSLGIETRPVIPGPVTFLMLSKLVHADPKNGTTLDLIGALLPIYEELLEALAEKAVAWVQLDEPGLVLDLDERAKDCYRHALGRLSGQSERPHILLATYFGALGDNLSLAVDSGCEGLHVDLVRGPEQLDGVLAAMRPGMLLSAGVVNGRNVWRTDLDAAHALVRRAVKKLGPERVLVAPSCSLLHVPLDLASEQRLDAELKTWLAFAAQKLDEVRAIAGAAESHTPEGSRFAEARAALASRRASSRINNPDVRRRVSGVNEAMLCRASTFPERIQKQHAQFNLPSFPTTTIGSFPQTVDVRAARAALRSGRMTAEEYERFLQGEVQHCVAVQEAAGIDVLVHGEFERNDMVEYFGEQLDGFAFTENGWVQSYGSRCVKPPILFGDIARPRPMTVAWSRYAQALTSKPVKGMLTGPVTILQWSFVRDDQERGESCMQIALALRDEVMDLEAAGIGMIQVDEPAIREGLPLRRSDREAYLRWAVDAFRLVTGGADVRTQIHTHMCYAEFGDILDAIIEMDADVISIEASRSRMELLVDFGSRRYPNEIGPGVYDIHSPRVPAVTEMLGLIKRAAETFPPERLWVNPDCGLKTRGWAETEAALRNMVEAARAARHRR